jgi:hypothetical protein
VVAGSAAAMEAGVVWSEAPSSELGAVECAGRKMDDSFLRTSKMYVARIFKKS